MPDLDLVLVLDLDLGLDLNLVDPIACDSAPARAAIVAPRDAWELVQPH